MEEFASINGQTDDIHTDIQLGQSTRCDAYPYTKYLHPEFLFTLSALKVKYK